MEWSFLFFLNSALLGVGLAMDAFSVSMANGLHDPGMSRKRMCIIAGTFGVFQAVMPMTGWVCVHTIVEMFSSFETFIPWIALALLGYIGGKMLIDGIRGEETEEAAALSAGALFMQGVATSIDALSVGFTIAEYGWLMALAASGIIAVVTFFLCMAGLRTKTVGIYEKDTGRHIVCNVEGYPYSLIWSAPAKPVRFVCIEPWQSLPGAEDDPQDWNQRAAAACLAPGEEWSTTLSTTFER